MLLGVYKDRFDGKKVARKIGLKKKNRRAPGNHRPSRFLQMFKVGLNGRPRFGLLPTAKPLFPNQRDRLREHWKERWESKLCAVFIRIKDLNSRIDRTA
jgi:hypothetical protein